MKVEILCPKCTWEPDGGSYWRCSCGHNWNTFDTAGKCPNCKKVWAVTQCPVCGEWSKHILWYKNLSDEMRKEIEKILNQEPVEKN